jgi:tRNA threonylcarbamoyladenosine biosynthesis protein TsaB
MSSLTQLLASHRSLLVLDAASTRVQVGWLRPGVPGRWESIDAEAGNALFAGTAALLRGGGAKIEDIDAFVFCEGPGSMLGIRTVAMALRTWQVLQPRPAFAYQSLAIAGHFAWRERSRSFAVISDARRDTWHVQAMAADGAPAPLQRVPVAELPAGELLTPENFRAWAKPPRPVAACGYDLAQVFPAIAAHDCFRLIEAADAFQHEAPEYKKWSAQVHSAATAPAK